MFLSGLDFYDYNYKTCLYVQALGPYSVSKTALLGLTRALAPDLAHSNIRVNCVAPGVIKTRFSNAVKKKHTFSPFQFDTNGFAFQCQYSCILVSHLHLIPP